MAIGDTRAEVLLRQAAVAPSQGMPLPAVDALLEFLSGALSGGDYETAVALMLAAVNPAAAAT
jgi:hypothetical protein